MSRPNPDVLIGGFIPSDSTQVVIRAIGPSLAGFGVPMALPDPVLSIHDANGTQIAANDDWMDEPESGTIQNLGLAPTNALEAALLAARPAEPTTAVFERERWRQRKRPR